MFPLFLVLFLVTSLFAVTDSSGNHHLDDIVVVARLPESEFGYRYDELGEVEYDTKEILKLPSVGEADVARALKYMSGVSGANENSSELIVHGGAPEQNLSIIDDIPLYSVDHFFGFFSPFNSKAVESVKLYKGFYPHWYGGKLSGVIDYSGTTGSYDTLSAGVTASMLTLSGYLSSPLGKNGSLLVAGRRSYSDLVQTPLYDAIFNQFTRSDDLEKDLENYQVSRSPEFYFYDINGKLSFRFGSNDSLAVAFYHGKDELSTTSAAHANDKIQVEPIPGAFVPRSVDVKLDNSGFWGNTGWSGSWFHRWPNLLETKLTGGYSTYFFGNTENFWTGAITAYDVDTNVVAFQTKQNRDADNAVSELFGKLRSTLTTDLQTIDAGVDIQQFSTHFNQMESYSDLTGDVGEEAELFTYYDSTNMTNDSLAEQLGALWIQDQFTPGKALSLTGGVRGSYFTGTEEFYWSPRFSVVVTPWEWFSMRGNWGIYHQFLSRAQMYDLYLEGDRYFWIIAQRDGAPVSHSQKSTLGVTFKPAGFIIDIEGFYNRHYDISLYRESFTPSVDNFAIGESWARGVDFMIQKKIRSYTGWVSFSLNKAIYQFGKEVNHGEPFYSPYDHTKEFKIVQMFDIRRFNVSATWTYATGSGFETPVGTYEPDYFYYKTTKFGLGGWKNSERLPDYHRLDFAASYRFSFGKKVDMTVAGSVFNCYNRKNIRNYGFEHRMDRDGKNIDPFVIYRTESYYLGIVPSLSISLDFKHVFGGEE